MLSLAIDTSAHFCAAALHDDGDDRIVGEISLDIGRGHAERLMDLVGELLHGSYADIDRIFCAAGPGSFTGVRIGLAASRGMALALDRPAYGLGVLDALAEAAIPRAERANLLVVADARRGEAYCQYSGPAADGTQPFLADYDDDPRLMDFLSLPDLSLCGSGAPILAERTGSRAPILHDLATAPISVFCRMGANQPAARLAPEPIYLRGADAKPQHATVLAR